MNIYLISQSTNDGLDTYDSAVVAAETEEDAVNTHPDGTSRPFGNHDSIMDWVDSPDKVIVKKIGVADDSIGPCVILASFNAG